jgi:glycogenin
MKKAFITILTTENYLPGVVVMFNSLKNTKTNIPFYCMINEKISQQSINILQKSGITPIKVNLIHNPVHTNPNDRKYYNYNKLNMYGMVQFDKLVYIDSDMIIFKNIDDLFEKDHMSSTNAGGEIPEFRLSWNQLNSGLVVVKPSTDLFNDLISKIGKITVKDVGDQAFIHSYYPQWARMRNLHLSHVYNTFSCHLASYEKLGYIVPQSLAPSQRALADNKFIRIVHYIGNQKPWMMMEEIEKISTRNATHQQLADKLWVSALRDYYQQSGTKLSDNEKTYVVKAGLMARK